LQAGGIQQDGGGSGDRATVLEADIEPGHRRQPLGKAVAQLDLLGERHLQRARGLDVARPDGGGSGRKGFGHGLRIRPARASCVGCGERAVLRQAKARVERAFVAVARGDGVAPGRIEIPISPEKIALCFSETP